MTPPVVLTIAGSDSAGGAGIQADLRTFAAHGVHGATVVTVVTAQNTVGTDAAHPVPLAVVARQLDSVLSDLPVAAVKTGMLATAEAVELVADVAQSAAIPHWVVDPVLVDAAGRALFDADVSAAYRERLFPLASVITPNLHEAALLTDVAPDRAGMAEAARFLGRLGPTVVVKGGRLSGDAADDVVYHAGTVRHLTAPMVATGNDHGTGCSLAAAIACRLAHGDGVVGAIQHAKVFVGRAIEGAIDWRLGRGRGPIDHLGWSSANSSTAD